MELKVFVEKNPKVLLSEEKTRALLKDVYMNDQLSVNLMMSAFSIGIITEMRKIFPVDEFTRTRWANKLVANFGVSTEKAQWAIDTWIAVVDHKLLKEIEAAEESLKQDQDELRKKQKEEARILVEQERKRMEEEEQAREESRRSSPDARLKTRDDYNDYYINPSLEESDKYIYIPCGFGQGDNGFLICGIKKELICRHRDANVYALIYNYLTRSSNFGEDDIPNFLKNIDTVYTLDYQTIYRLTIVLLQMVRHNLVNGVLALNYGDDAESLKYAVRLINNYAALFCRIIGIPTVQLQVKIDKAGIPLSLHNNKGIHIIENTNIVSNARELWYGRKINYHLTKDNLPDLEYILHEISDFEGFKEGQFSALCDMLSCNQTEEVIRGYQKEAENKYNEFINVLESTNVDQIFKEVQSLKQSMQNKFIVAMAGIGVTLIAVAISLILK